MNTLATSPHIGRSDLRTQGSDPGIVSISWFHNDVPPFAEAELIRLYQNTFSTLAKFRAYGAPNKVSTYLVRKRGEIVTLLLFRQEGRLVEVLNEFLTTDEEELNRFARHVFSTYKSVDRIRFAPLRAGLSRLAFPCHLECISRNGGEFHFLWGREQYRYRVPGIQRDFGALSIYRCRWDLVLDTRRILKAEIRMRIRQLTLGLLAPERRDGTILRLAVKFVRTMRRVSMRH